MILIYRDHWGFDHMLWGQGQSLPFLPMCAVTRIRDAVGVLLHCKQANKNLHAESSKVAYVQFCLGQVNHHLFSEATCPPQSYLITAHASHKNNKISHTHSNISNTFNTCMECPMLCYNRSFKRRDGQCGFEKPRLYCRHLTFLNTHLIHWPTAGLTVSSLVLPLGAMNNLQVQTDQRHLHTEEQRAEHRLQQNSF